MIKRINKVGNSSALIFDRALMELVGLKEGSEVQLTVRDGSIILTPANPSKVDPDRFEAALDRVATERRDVLRRLAE
jgi:antitoxin component of MazEF toxin-antitoxin module